MVEIDIDEAPQVKETTVYTSERYITEAQANKDGAVNIAPFEGFSDFELDLTCLSPAASPPASIYSDARSCSPSSSPRHSGSFQSSSPLASPTRLPLLRLSSITANSIVGGSLPLISRVGRGTPIDRNRRIEWGALGLEDVGEDGVLFSTARSTSLDSSAPQPSLRSISPEWNLLNRRPSTIPAVARNKRRNSAPERSVEPSTPPAIQLDETETSGEWASSFMETVLASSSKFISPSPPQSTAHDGQENIEAKPPSAETVLAKEDTWPPRAVRPEVEAGIDGALNIGIGYRDVMNWFDSGVLPADGRDLLSVRDSSSVYSSESIIQRPPSSQSRPRLSEPRGSPSVHSSETQPQPSPLPSLPQNNLQSSRPTSVTQLGTRSTNSVKEVGAAETSLEPKPSLHLSLPQAVWWRKWLRKFKKIHFWSGAH